MKKVVLTVLLGVSLVLGCLIIFLAARNSGSSFKKEFSNFEVEYQVSEEYSADYEDLDLGDRFKWGTVHYSNVKTKDKAIALQYSDLREAPAEPTILDESKLDQYFDIKYPSKSVLDVVVDKQQPLTYLISYRVEYVEDGLNHIEYTSEIVDFNDQTMYLIAYILKEEPDSKASSLAKDLVKSINIKQIDPAEGAT